MTETELLEAHLGLARREALRWRGGGPIETADLEQEGALGLLRAARRFDAGRGVPFHVFALPYVRGAIIDAVRVAGRRRRGEDSDRFAVVSLEDVVSEPAGAEGSVEEQADRRERLRLVAELPDAERHVLIRTEVDGAPAVEVAGELGVSVGRVYALASRGALRLRRRAA